MKVMLWYHYQKSVGNLPKGAGDIRRRLEETWGRPSPHSYDNDSKDVKYDPVPGG